MFHVTKIYNTKIIVNKIYPNGKFYVYETFGNKKVTACEGPFHSFQEAESYSHGHWFNYNRAELDYTRMIEYMPRISNNIYNKQKYAYCELDNDWIIFNRRTGAIVWRAESWAYSDTPWSVINRLNMEYQNGERS